MKITRDMPVPTLVYQLSTLGSQEPTLGLSWFLKVKICPLKPQIGLNLGSLFPHILNLKDLQTHRNYDLNSREALGGLLPPKLP